MKEYKKLDKALDYDKESAEEYAEAVNEARELENRLEYLKTILVENSDMSKVMWTTLEGKTIALHNIEDTHLSNILGHQVRNGRTISRELAAEATKRGISVPTQVKQISAEIIEDYEDIWSL